ncbi:hypothetical protein Daus18300_008461 [Diaporthe australafricana]|uniref:AAA+ ATPase domain-containing protein n=1 Tax=Diaporthe australafricana TaxID=127596 RepID=A0ABR3WIM1_9PEZI
MLRIADAVENIHEHLRDEDPREPSDKTLVNVVWHSNVERLALSNWTSSTFLSTGGLRKKNQSVLTAFYTERPEPKDLSVEPPAPDVHFSDDDFKAAYSKENWSIAPQRIIIHSREALAELQQITKVPQRFRPSGLVPPFKLLIHHRDTIKKRLDELQESTSDTAAHDSSSTADGSIRQRMIRDHLNCIHNFIQTDLKNYIGLKLKIRDGDIEEVLFEEIYHLFKPGQLVVPAATNEDQLYRVYSVTGGRMRLSEYKNNILPPGAPRIVQRFGIGVGTWTDLQIECYIMAWDGENIGPRRRTYSISYFAGVKKVTDLGVYPIQFQEDAAGLQSRLRARGRKLVQCFGHKRYTGSSVPLFPPLGIFVKDKKSVPMPGHRSDDSNDEDERHVPGTAMVRSDVYVDYKAFFSYSFTTQPALSDLSATQGEEVETREALGQHDEWNHSDHEVDAYLSDTFLSSHRYMTKFGKPKENLDDDGDRLELLPAQVPAFIFGSRKWEWLTLDIIQDLDKSEEARNSGWNELVIPKRFSGLLLSLVSNHISGPPGSGKTSTAETIAAYTGRPLYAITCGDIGTEPKELEKNLVQHTRLAEKWGCVLLLDEADVFLMSRTYDNMHRNAMVSVFLRQLEYYSGILFLTTNIVGVIDEAFKSRIHVALEYPAVDEESTLEIWSNLLQRIKRDNKKSEVKIRFDEEALLLFAKKHYRKHQHNGTTWNGRQIRNAFQTAIGIGQFERLKKIDEATARGESPDRSTRYIRLSVTSFGTVAETASDFEKYITKTRGDDRERAALHQFRQDEQSREPPPKKSYRTPVSTYQTDQDTGASRAGRSRMKSDRRYHGASGSPGVKRTAKGKEVYRKISRRVSDSDDRSGRDAAGRLSDGGSDAEIIEQDLEDEDEDEDEDN